MRTDQTESATTKQSVSKSAQSQISESQNDETVKSISISQDKYVYQTLDAATKTVYDEVLNAILKQSTEITVSTLDKDVLDNAYNAVMADYGGLFWVSGYVYTEYSKDNALTTLTFSPKYTMNSEQRKSTQQQIDTKAEEILSGISISDNDYDKAKYVYKTLIELADYVPNAADSQNIISVFINKQTVCQGYACATQYLLNLLGIKSAIISGQANNQTHAWNLVYLDGQYYYMDTTWGNSTFTDSKSQASKFVNYNYLNITSQELLRTHTISSKFTLPDCVATDDNYFLKEGLYYVDWYPKEIGNLYKNAWEDGQKDISVKFADSGLYNKAMEYFIKNQHLVDYCSKLKTFYYMEDKQQNILTINFY